MSYFQSYSAPDAHTFDAFKNLSDISTPVKRHLTQVYGTLATLCVVAAIGTYIHINELFFFGGGTFAFLLALGSIIGIAALPDTPDNKLIRYGFLYNFAFMEGLSLGPLIDYILVVDHSERIIINACSLTALVFGSFTLVSLLTNKRMFIYLGGLLASTLSIFFWMSFINIFLNSKILYLTELYLGLLMFCGYVIYDTQLIIYRATYLKSFDVVSHTLDLFIDLIGLFVRILIILSKESGNNNNNNNGRRRNNKERRSYVSNY